MYTTVGVSIMFTFRTNLLQSFLTPVALFTVFIVPTFSVGSVKDGYSSNEFHTHANDSHVMQKLTAEEARFDCNVSNISQALWKRSTNTSSGLLFSGLNPRDLNGRNFNISVENYSLHLDLVAQEDEGIYTCIEQGKIKANYLLIVKVRSVKDGYSSNKVHAYANDSHVMQKLPGEEARFDCNVSNISLALWKRSTNTSSGLLFSGLNPRDFNGRNFNISVENYSLHLDLVAQEDEGIYTCIEQGKIKADYLLIVKALSPCSREDRNSLTVCCTSDTVQEGLQRIGETEVNEGNVKEVAEHLEQVSKHAEHIHPGDLESIVHILHDIVNTKTCENQVIAVTDSVLNIASNIMAMKLEIKDQAAGVGKIPRLLEKQAMSIHSKQRNYSQILDYVAFSAVQISQSSLTKEVTFGSFNDESSAKHGNPPFSKRSTGLLYEQPSADIMSTITLPISIIEETEKNISSASTVPLSFLIFRDSTAFPVKQTSSLSKERKPIISSYVISATVGFENIGIKDLPDDSQIVTTFYSFPVMENRYQKWVVEKRECVSWKYNESDGSGEWSRDGCRKVEDSPEKRRVRCLCNHLTSFAVLVHFQVVYQRPHKYLAVIFKIGCGLSIVTLSSCIVTLLSFKSARTNQQSQIHINLCLALAALHLTFFIGIDGTKNHLGCKLASSLILYFAVSSMAWMSVEAVNLFLRFWMMRRSKTSHLIPIAIVVAWGGPLVAAISVFFFDRDGSMNNFYRLSSPCLLHPGYELYIGFLEIGLLFLFNCFIFILITYKVTCRKILATNEEAKRKERIARIRDTFFFCMFLGIPWAFGFLSVIVPSLRILFEVLLAVFLSLQGLCMFYMFVIKNPEIKRGVTIMTRSLSTSLRENKSHITAV